MPSRGSAREDPPLRPADFADQPRQSVALRQFGEFDDAHAPANDQSI
jgi:hypothetical protein